jgi:hypothetical protein
MWATTLLALSAVSFPLLSQEAKAEQPEVDYSAPANVSIRVPRNVTQLKEKTLPHYGGVTFVASASGTDSADPDAVRGLRNFALELLPGEKITAELRAFPQTLFYMNWAVPVDAADPLQQKIKRTHLTQEKLSLAKVEFQNTLDKSYTINLFLQGRYNVPYTINLKRTPNKK